MTVSKLQTCPATRLRTPSPKKMCPKFLDKSLCTGCGLCASSCPTGAINRETLSIDTDKCINCMRCSFVCPSKARSFHADETKAWLEANCSEPRQVEYFL